MRILDIVIDTGLAIDMLHAASMFQYGGISIDGTKIFDPYAEVLEGTVIDICGNKYIYEGRDRYHAVTSGIFAGNLY